MGRMLDGRRFRQIWNQDVPENEPFDCGAQHPEAKSLHAEAHVEAARSVKSRAANGVLFRVFPGFVSGCSGALFKVLRGVLYFPLQTQSLKTLTAFNLPANPEHFL